MFEIYHHAKELPARWDKVMGERLFLCREVLDKLEKLNPCKQQYHLHREKKLALVSYQLKLDLFTFTKKLSLKIPMRIIGIPLSVSGRGYVAAPEDLEELSLYIQSLQGFHVVLNADEGLGLARGSTLPTCKIDLQWNTFDDYVNSMRSHYRYRAKKAMKKFVKVKVEALADRQLFDEEMYHLYEGVYENSKEKLEKLSIHFFREFPAKIFTFKVHGKVIGFVQLVEKSGELVFLFGGFEHSINQSYDLYMNMLLQIVRYGIERDYRSIDLGQTAEETKLKLGAVQQPRWMYVHHSNKILNKIIGTWIDTFSYKKYGVFHNVFKGEEDENPAGKMP